MKRIAVVVFTNYDRDIRVIRETESLREFGYDPHVFCCVIRKGEEKKTYKRNGIKINKMADLLWYVPKNLAPIKAFYQMKKIVLDEPVGFAAIHCHDVNAALVGYAVSKELSIPLICDFHELFVDYLKDPGIRHKIIRPIVLHLLGRCWEFIGKRIASRSQAFITVNGALASIYSKRWRLTQRPIILHNYSSSTLPKKSLHRAYFRRKYSISPKRKVLIFQGGLNSDKGIDVILDAFHDQQEFSVVFLGEGALRPLIEQYCRIYAGKFFWHHAVPAKDVILYTRCADAGLAPIGDQKQNHVFSTPNKVFEYLAAGIPFVCTALPEMSKIAADSGAGIAVPVGDAKALYAAACQIFESADKYRMLCRLARESFKRKYCWEKESGLLKELYKKLLGE